MALDIILVLERTTLCISALLLCYGRRRRHYAALYLAGLQSCRRHRVDTETEIVLGTRWQRVVRALHNFAEDVAVAALLLWWDEPRALLVLLWLRRFAGVVFWPVKSVLQSTKEGDGGAECSAAEKTKTDVRSIGCWVLVRLWC